MPVPVDLSDASNLLWRQRRLLDLLLFKLDAHKAQRSSGSRRWMARSTHEIELVQDALRSTELTRAVVVDAIARRLGLCPGCSLGELAAACPRPWGGIFREHHQAFLALTEELASEWQAYRSPGVRDNVVPLLPEGPQGPIARRSHREGGSVLLGSQSRVTSTVRSGVASTAPALLPSLLDFLRSGREDGR